MTRNRQNLSPKSNQKLLRYLTIFLVSSSVGAVVMLTMLYTSRDSFSSGDTTKVFGGDLVIKSENESSLAYYNRIKARYPFVSGKDLLPDTTTLGNHAELSLQTSGHSQYFKIKLNTIYHSQAEIKLYDPHSQLIYKQSVLNAAKGTEFVVDHTGWDQGPYMLIVRLDNHSPYKERIYLQ